MLDRFIVYILQSENHPEKYYVGYTTDLKRRFQEHNNKSQVYSKQYDSEEIK